MKLCIKFSRLYIYCKIQILDKMGRNCNAFKIMVNLKSECTVSYPGTNCQLEGFTLAHIRYTLRSVSCEGTEWKGNNRFLF